MSMYGSQRGLNMSRRAGGSRGDLTGGMSQQYARSEVVHGGGNGYEPYMEGYNTYTFSRHSMGGGGTMGRTVYTSGGVMSGGGMMSGGEMMGGGGMMGGGEMMVMSGGMSASNLGAIHQRAMVLQNQCQDYLKRAEFALQSGNNPGDAERYMGMAKETIEQLKNCAMDLRQMGQPNDNVVRTLEMCKDQLKGVHMAISGTMTRRRSTRGSSGGWEEPTRSFQDAMGWIAQQKRLIETAPWGDDAVTIDQQLTSHSKFHSSIQRSSEVDRARDDLIKKGDKASLHALDQEWDSLQKLSFGRTEQLHDLQKIIQDMSKEIMWVNDREEEELMFDWGDKNIDQYIPRKQESYSRLMSSLEDKEKDLNKLKAKVDTLLKNNHPAADKIEAYKDTLQTQWSWLLQITKCIDTHLKENSAYCQFFKEANETYSNLQKEHEMVRKKFTCDKNTSLEDLLNLLQGLEREKEKIMENKRQVQHLVSRSRSIVRLKPRNPEEKSSNQIIVKALCDFKQDQKVICKNDEAILKDNSQRSKWNVTGPGGLDMMVPSVCLIVPPPNPISISLANKNEQYYEAILSIWNQLYINVKSLVAWQYCLQDIKYINSLTMTMLARMRPEEYRQIIKTLESHFEEFKLCSKGSQMFEEEEAKIIENQFNEAQTHYEQLVVQLPAYIQEETETQQVVELQQQQQLLLIQKQEAEEEAWRLEQVRRQEEARRLEETRRLEEERRRVEIERQAKKKAESAKKEQVIKKEVVKVIKSEPPKKKVVVSSSSTSRILSELHLLRLRLDGAEDTLSQHIHICLGDDGLYDCSSRISQLETVQRDVDSMREEFLSMRERIMKELEGMNDADKAQFLRSEIGVINQRLGSLESSSSAYLQRLRALRDMLESVARAEDIVKVYEARLTEKETTSLSPSEVEDYISALKSMKFELDQKKDVLIAMETELAKASHWNGQVGSSYHRCDMMLSKYTEQVSLLSDRWRRILGQIETRVQDLQSYLPQLQHYTQTSTSLSDWIDVTKKKQDTLQATKIDSIPVLKEHIINQKTLNSEIMSRRETVDSVLRDNEACVTAIKDYETDLNSYASGLETLLNIGVKRTMLKSPSMDLNQEATQLQTRYMELLTYSGDYYKFLGQLLKNMEELKIRNTRIDLLEEELRQLKEDMLDRNSKYKSLEDALSRSELELSASKDQLLSMEEVKASTALQVSTTRETLEGTQGQLADLSDRLERLTYLLEEEKRKKRLAEERYTKQQEEYEAVLGRRQKELETISWSKVELEKSVANKDQEIEQLRRQLADETARLQRDISKVRSQCSKEINNLKLNFESQIQASQSDAQRLAAQREEDTITLQLQYDRIVAEKRELEDELRRLRLSLNQAEDHRMRAEEEAHSQHAIITEERRRRRELESQVEGLMRQRDEQSSQYNEELAELTKRLQERTDELAYITHNLEEETRRRKTVEEGQGVLEQTLSQMQSKLSGSSLTVTQLQECKNELEKLRLEMERESKERSRVEHNMSRLQSRMKDLQAVRDSLESQVENLRQANQEEIARKKQVEAELEKATTEITEYNRTINLLRQSQEHASMSERRGEEERLRLQGELEKNLRQSKTSAERMSELSAEMKALQQQLLQEQARGKEANLKNEGLYKTIEERGRVLNENYAELQKLKEMIEIQTKERLRLEEDLRTAHHDKEELLRAKQDQDDELSSQITALQLQLQTSERSNLDYRNLVSELSSEREKLNLEAVQIQKQAMEDKERIRRLEEDRLERENTSLKSEIERVMVSKTMEPPPLNPSSVVFDGVRKKVTADQLLDCAVLDEPTFSQLAKGHRTVPEVSADKKINLKGTGPIAGVIVEGPGAGNGPLFKMTFAEAKKEGLMPPDSVDLLLDAQAATGHIIDPRINQKFTVEEALDQGVVDETDKQRLLEAEAAAVGYRSPSSNKPLSAYEAMKKGLIDKNTALRLLQAQESVGGILDPVLSVFLPRDTAVERNLVDDSVLRALNQRPELYQDPESEEGTTYMTLKRKCKVELNTNLLLLPVQGKVDPSQLVFDGVRKPVTAKQLAECKVIDKPTLDDLEKGKKTVPEVSEKKKVNLKGTGPIAGILVGPSGKMSLADAKKKELISADCADLLLDAQAATGHIIDPMLNQKLTVEEALDQGVVDETDKQRLLEAEAAAVGYKSPSSNKPLSAYEAMKKGLIDKNTALRLLQAQESVGGVLDPVLSVFLPRETAVERKLVDDSVLQALDQKPEHYQDPESEEGTTYMTLKKRCKVDPTTKLLLLPVSDLVDPSKLVFDGVRKPVTAKQLAECKVIDKPTLKDLQKGNKNVPEVSEDKKVNLKGTGPIAGILVGSSGKMSFTEAKKKEIIPKDCADLLLDAQAATGHIIDPRTNKKLTVDEACYKDVVDEQDKERLLAAEAAAVGYRSPSSNKPLSVFEAMKKGVVDKNTALRLLQAQESVGGVLDPTVSVFLPRDTAVERKLVDDSVLRALDQKPELYQDPESEEGTTYTELKKRCKVDPATKLLLLPVSETEDPSELVFEGVRKPVTAKQLAECKVLDKPTLKDLQKGKKTVPEVSEDKKVNLKGTGPIAGILVGSSGKMSLAEAKKKEIIPSDCADLLLDAQAATGHIIDPRTNKKLTVDEACNKDVVDQQDKERLLAAEAAAVGYRSPSSNKPLSVFEAMKKGLIDKNTALRLLQAQESVGGVLDPTVSVFLPRDTAVERKLVDDSVLRALDQKPKLYQDPESEEGTTYTELKKRCKVDPTTKLLLLPVSETEDPSELVFDGVRKPVTAKQLAECKVLDKPTLKDLQKGNKNVPEVSEEKKVNLKGTGPIAGILVGSSGKMSFTEAKKKEIIPKDCADLLLDAQAATGHIIDPRTNKKLTVDEACYKDVVDEQDKERLLAAEAAAVGYRSPSSNKPLSVFEAMKKGVVDKNTALRLLQAQESVGGVLDPKVSVFLPRDTAVERKLVDDSVLRALDQKPKLYQDPESEEGTTYTELKKRCKVDPTTKLLLLPVCETEDPSELLFDGVRKPVTAKQLAECKVLDKPTLKDLQKGKKTVPEVSEDKKVNLKGTGPIAGILVGTSGKMSFTDAKKKEIIPSDCADLLLDAQAATGHIIDPRTNKKLTVNEACNKDVVDEQDKERLLAAEAAAVGYKSPSSNKPLSVFEAMKKGLIDKNTALRLLQAQESVGGVLDPTVSVFLPRDTAVERKLVDDSVLRALDQKPKLYQDPESEEGTTYTELKKRCKEDPTTKLLLLPVPETRDPSELVFEGVRKPVTAKQLAECNVLDKPTLKELQKGKKSVPEVSEEKKVNLKGTGPIAGVVSGSSGKVSLTEAKKQGLLPEDCADLLLDAQAATGHIIDPRTNKKLTVDEACYQGVVDRKDKDRLLAAEAAAVGYKSLSSNKPLSVFEALKKGLIDKNTALRLLQAQESVGGVLDPVLSVFLPRDTAVERKLVDDSVLRALDQKPELYLDPESEEGTTYTELKKRCKEDPTTKLLLLPVSETKDPNKLVFEGVRKPVTAKELAECKVLEKPTLKDLQKGKKSVPEVSEEKKVNLKGTGPIAGVMSGTSGKVSLTEAKKQGLLPEDCADLLLDAQAATGHIIDPRTNKKLTVDEACNQGVVDRKDKDRLLAAEAAAVGYRSPSSNKPLSVFEALNKGVIDKNTALRLLQAQESVGGVLDPTVSVFLPRDTAVERKLVDDSVLRALDQKPELYLDPESEEGTTYTELKKRCKEDPTTKLLLLPVSDLVDPSKLVFEGVRKPVTAKELAECNVLDKPTLKDLQKGKKTVPEVAEVKKIYLKGTGPIAGIMSGTSGKLSLTEAKKQGLLPEDCADLLLDAQAATGHIIDPRTNKKLTVDEACNQGVVDRKDKDRLLAAEAAAVGYKSLSSNKPLSVFEALKKGVIDKNTALRLLQAQESVGGVLDPTVSVFLPRDTAVERKLVDDSVLRALDQKPKLYLDPESEEGTTYTELKKRCKEDPTTKLLLLPVSETTDPNKLVFEGVRKPVTAKELAECKVLEKPTLKDLQKGKKSVPEVSEEKKVNLKGTGPIAGVMSGPSGKVSLTEAKKQGLLPEDCADLLLDAQAATGHIIDPRTNKKLTVDEACYQGVVDRKDKDRLLAAEAAAVGYRSPSSNKPLSVFEAMKKGVVDKNTALRLLQAQESVGGVLDPVLSVFLPRDTAVERKLVDDSVLRALDQKPKLYQDPESEEGTTYTELKKRCKEDPTTKLLLLPVSDLVDPSELVFDGVRKPVTAKELAECKVLDKPTLNDLQKGKKSVPEVSEVKKIYLKGTGPIAGVMSGTSGKVSLTEAKKQGLLPKDCADLLLDAQAATGHIIDPRTNKKLTVDEACNQGVVDRKDKERLLAAEAAAVGYRSPSSNKPLSVFEAMKKGVIDKNTALRLLQAQESVGGVLDPVLSVFLPRDTAVERKLVDDSVLRALDQKPKLYLDPESEEGTTYTELKKRCKEDPTTKLLLLPVSDLVDPSKLVFDGVRKPVTAKELAECKVLDKPTLNDLQKGKKSVPEVSEAKKDFLKGTGPIAGVVAGSSGKVSLTEAKKQGLLPEDCADLLLDAQAATGHIIDPRTNKKLTVDEACYQGVVDRKDKDRLLAAEAAAVGYRSLSSNKPLSVFEAMKKGVIDKNTALRLLQAQESVGGVIDPTVSVFLPRETAVERKLVDDSVLRALDQKPRLYLDPESEDSTTYTELKKRCKEDPTTKLLLLPVSETKDPSKLVFEGVRKPVTAKELAECKVLDKPTLNDLQKGKKTVPEVSEEKKVNLKGTGPIAGVVSGSSGKVSLTEAKKQGLLPEDCADLLLDAQAATGHIIDPRTNKKLTVDEACYQGVVDRKDKDRLLAAEAAAVGYRSPSSNKPVSVLEAMKKGVIDKNTALRLLQAQESVGGVLDPVLSVFLPRDTAVERKLVDDSVLRALDQKPKLYLDPENDEGTTYTELKKRCKEDPTTKLLLLPVSDLVDPSKLVFEGVRKPVTAKELAECKVLDKPTLNDLQKGKKTVPEVSEAKKDFLKGNGSIAGVMSGTSGKMSIAEAKKQGLLPEDCADLLLDAQAATGHIIDPRTNKKLTVDEACYQGVIDRKDKDRLLAAEAAAVGYRSPSSNKPLSVFEAMKKGVVDKNTALRLLQAQESVGGVLDPTVSVFLPRDTAVERKLVDDSVLRALDQKPRLYLDPENDEGTTYTELKKRCKEDPTTKLLLLPVSDLVDPSKLVFDGVRKPVTAKELAECKVLDKPTLNDLQKGKTTVPEVSEAKNDFLKGNGSIAGVMSGTFGKMSIAEAKKQGLLPEDCADLLLDAQAATGHIIDPRTNKKLTVDEACYQGVVDRKDKDRLLAAEAAAVGYRSPSSNKPLSVFEAMKKGVVDKNTALRLLQAQESVGGVLDPTVSVFLPRDTAVERKLVDDSVLRALDQKPKLYLDPENDEGTTYTELKKRCKEDPTTKLLLLPVSDLVDPSKLVFEGVRKPVTAKELAECKVLDKPTLNDLQKGKKTVQEVSEEKKDFLKGNGSIAGVMSGPSGKMSIAEAKKQGLLPEDCADLLLDAQAATGHIIDPRTNKKLTVDEACYQGVVDRKDKDRLLAAEAAAVGYRSPSSNKPLSVLEAMKKGVIDNNTALRLLQAQESVGGILDPTVSVFLPRNTAVERKLVDDSVLRALDQKPELYLDPETERNVTYMTLKSRCKVDPATNLLFLSVSERADPSQLFFEGVRKPVTAKQLVDCGVLDKLTLKDLQKGTKSVQEVSVDKKVNLRGTGCIAGVSVGPSGKMSIAEAKKQGLMPADCADFLLDAQAATGHIIDPTTNKNLSVDEACAVGVVEKQDRDRLLKAESAAVGFRDPSSAKLISVFEAVKKGLIDQKTGIRLLQAQESVGGILDPTHSLFLPKETAIKQNILDEDLCHILNKKPECYLDPYTHQATSYISLKKKCKIDSSTGLLLLPELQKPVTVQGLRSQVSVKDLVDAKLLKISDMDQLRQGKLTSKDIEDRLGSYLRGSTCIAGIYDEANEKVVSIYQAMKDGLLRPGTTLELLEAQAASGFMVDPINNQYLSVNEAYNKKLFGPEHKDSLLSAERAVTGYSLPGTGKVISLFQAIERGLVEKGHGIRLLEAQIASGGIIDPEHSHRIDVDVAYKRGYFDEKMHKILSSPTADTKGFFDPNTEENLTYKELKQRCITDKTGLILLPIMDKSKQESILKNTLRKRRVIIVDPETNKEMTVREAYTKGLIDRETFLELSEQECEWEEITITAPDGTTEFKIVDRKTGKEYDITEMLEVGVITQSDFDQYRAGTITLTQLADIITDNTRGGSSSSFARPLAASGESSMTSTSSSSSRQSAFPSSSSVTISSSSRTSAAPSSSAVISSSASSRTYTSQSSRSVISSSTSERASASQSSSTVLSSSTSPRSSASQSSSTVLSSSTSPRSSASQSSSSITSTSPGSSASQGSMSVTSTTLRSSGTSDPLTLTSSSSLSSSSVQSRPLSPIFTRMTTTKTTTLTEKGSISSSVSCDTTDAARSISSISISLASPTASVSDQEPVGAVFDTETLEKISVTEALNRDLLDSITAQRLLEAQACTGGIINPANGQKLGIIEAARQGIIDDDMVSKLKPAQKAYIGFEDLKTRRKMSAAEAIKEMWLPYEAGHRFLEFQYVTGGFRDPEMGCKRSIQDALLMGWFDERRAQKLQDVKTHTKNLTCPKTKLKISYKEALDNCLSEESTGVRMLPASSISSCGISSPYNVSSAPGSTTGSRSGSRRGSRRGSLDLGSPMSTATHYTFSSTSYSSYTK